MLLAMMMKELELFIEKLSLLIEKVDVDDRIHAQLVKR